MRKLSLLVAIGLSIAVCCAQTVNPGGGGGGGGGASPAGPAFRVNCYKDATHFEACGTSGEATVLGPGASDPGALLFGIGGVNNAPSNGDSGLYFQYAITAPGDITGDLYMGTSELDLGGSHNYARAIVSYYDLEIQSTGTVGKVAPGFPAAALVGNVNQGSAALTSYLAGVFGDVQVQAGTVSIGSAFWAWIGNYGGTSTLLTDYYGQIPDSGGSATTFVTFYSEGMGGVATNAYSFWDDEQGVCRIKADNTFNAVYQGIFGCYDPQDPKYIPGSTNYSRYVLQWESHEAWLRTEAAGTGTLRRIGLGSAGLDNSTTDVALPFVNSKMSASASAPGAGKADLRWLAGTNAGTCKLVANAGTSATEVTIIDNVGGGC